MLYTIKTFDGHAINDGSSYRAVGLNFGTPPAGNLTFIDLANSDPVYAGVYTGEARNLAVAIEVVGPTAVLTQQLKTWLKRGTSGLLVVTVSTDGQDYQLDCAVQSLAPDGTFRGRWVLILQAGPSAWRRVSAETDSWTADTTHLTKTITVTGVEETRLIASITPSAPAPAGWQYQYVYQLINKKGLGYGVRPWCITIDTAALVTAGKLQADGDDLRVVVNGVEVKRWLADMNTDHTHVWFNVDIQPGYSLTLKTAVAASGEIGELSFKVTSDNLAALRAMPARGILVHGTEWIQYSGKSTSLYKLGVEQRGACATTLQAHAVGDTFQYIQNVVYVLAGNSAATAPALTDAAYDDDKPLFDLSASDNTQWVWTASTLFYDAAHPTRPGTWSKAIKRAGKESLLYWFTQNAGSGNPSLGSLMATWQRNGTWQAETATLTWEFYSPSGMNEISVTGTKYRSTSRWPSLAALRRFVSGAWANSWTETSPVNEDTWTAFTHAAQALTGNPKRIQIIFKGTMRAAANADAYFEILTATVKFVTANLPSGSMLAEGANYPLSMRLKNNTTGDEVTITYPMLTGKTLLLDGENYALTYDGVNAHGALEVDDPSRAAWIRLTPGSNDLIATVDEIGTVGIALSWYPRVP